ncbi:NAD(P)-dependent oxidoreductase [Deinococcus aerophilus]|uniref:3-hydroxyisobutyrate dehydrogenase n=1 Tax=Deinococcus aerophilus TaxID=522488 RepID=A0ABQ2GM38_9DEIO|nr:NAD(P)-dependent oxidoreductase [Deinococcus aerophilus]GGM02143.1 3-hydroxyisobutyrate dehydrogenase [Deinococcus aerophilus]
MTRVAFLGLGAMGVPMAAALARRTPADGPTLVWNRHFDRAQAHAAEYGTHAATLQEVAGAGVIFTCLPTSADVDEVIGQIEEYLKEGTVWVDCTSGHPDAAHAQRGRLLACGVKFLDAPVSGGVTGAQAGTLTVMLGGPADEVQAVRPHLAFADKIVHVGNTGAGFTVKAINNALLAVNLWAAGEGLAALAGSGVDLGAALTVINASSGRSNASENLIPARVLTREFPPTFGLGLLAKDIGIALDVASANKSSTPVLAQVGALCRAAAQMVGPAEDHTAMLKLVEQMNGKELR